MEAPLFPINVESLDDLDSLESACSMSGILGAMFPDGEMREPPLPFFIE